MVCDWPTMPKRGVVTSTTRRSRSLRVPVISACTGALKPSAAASAGTSWTRPSVIRIAPATRSGGTSASAALSAENSRVPSVSPSASPASTKRTSRPGMRPSRSASCARAASVCFGAVAEILARALVDHDRDDRGQRLAVLARERRIGERQHHQRERERRARSAPRLRDDEQQRREHERDAQPPPTARRRGTSGAKAMPKLTMRLLLPQPFEQRRHVDLVGLVVAGQRVHHDVDAGAEGEFALARLARHHRQHRLAVRRASPRRRQDRSR